MSFLGKKVHHQPYFVEGKKWDGKGFFLSYLWLAPLLFALDIASKWAVVNAFHGEEGRSYEVIRHFFYITLTFNTGSSFGIGREVTWARYLFIAISWIASGLILYFWIRGLSKKDPWIDFVFSLCLAGAVGNAVDRTFYWPNTVGFSGVVDFFQFYIFGYSNASFAIFNVADSCLVVGIIFLLVAIIVRNVGKRGGTIQK